MGISKQADKSEAKLDEFALELRERAIAEARRRPLKLSDSADVLRAHIKGLVDRDAPGLAAVTRDELVDRVMTASVGFGPLEPLLADDSIDEIMVNGLESAWIERHGRIEPAPVEFTDERELFELIERIIAPLGRRVDEASPICDARLPDGSRVNVVIPPLSLNGPVLTIRRFSHARYDCDALVANGTISERDRELLALAVGNGLSILVSGGTGSGKTTTLNAISSFIPPDERIVTIEDAAELRLRQGHVVRLESRPPNLEGRGEVPIRALVKTALRMRPDRIVVGEVRGGEALDMLQAMTTGHDGSLTTVHASSAEGALARIETLALMAGIDVPHRAVRSMTGAAIDLVVHQRREQDGSRRVCELAEVLATDDGFELNSLMLLDDAGNPVAGRPRGMRVRNALAGVVG